MFILVYTTAGSRKEAVKIAQALIKEKLVACVNYFPIHSTYRWKGKIVSEREYALFCKTTKKNFSRVKHAIKRIHSYEIPAVVSIPLENGLADYLRWIAKSVI